MILALAGLPLLALGLLMAIVWECLLYGWACGMWVMGRFARFLDERGRVGEKADVAKKATDGR